MDTFTINKMSKLMAPLLLMFFGTAQSATFTTTGTFLSDTDSEGYFYSDGDPDEMPGSSDIRTSNIPVTGLSQFDPTLGTVTGITISSAFDLDVTVSIEVFDLLDFGQAHSAGFTMSAGSEEGIGSLVRYNPTSNPSFFASLQFQNFDISVSCSGLAGDDPCTNSVTDTFTFSAPDENIFNNSNTTKNLEAADYLGTGTLDRIKVSPLFYTGQLWNPGTDTVNVFEAEGAVTTLLGPGTVTLTYEYDAAVVPVPAAVWLFGSGLLGLAGVARRKKTT